ncbi:hypothetical protein [Domibacillus sp.]|uniref:hypothetical protein n=1 Tax=Domibacillus sp. TaxID=1969783 RepID=UPI002811B7B8|nr:hypothetical protein [Domibacillus sp.]
MKLDQTLKDLLAKANLYGLLAKKYEYLDPEKHMYYDLKHFHYVTRVEQHYMMLKRRNDAPHMMMSEEYNNAPHMMMPQGHNNAPNMMPGQFPRY